MELARAVVAISSSAGIYCCVGVVLRTGTKDDGPSDFNCAEGQPCGVHDVNGESRLH